MLKNIVILALAFSSFGCVSTHMGPKATSSLEGDTLVVSSAINKNLSDKYYMFIEYTFENKSGKWKDIKVSRLGFDKVKSTEILVNSRLNSWVEGAELKLKKSNYNTAVILGSIAAVGGVVGGLSNDGNLQVAGLGAMVGAAGVADGIAFSQTRQKAGSGVKGVNQTVNVPSNYVLAPFKVAPESYVKRWVVVKRPNKIVVGGKLPTGPLKRKSKTDLWAEEDDNEKHGRLVMPKMVSEITQNEKTVIYTTTF